jgi:hypothetical protein
MLGHQDEKNSSSILVCKFVMTLNKNIRQSKSKKTETTATCLGKNII